MIRRSVVCAAVLGAAAAVAVAQESKQSPPAHVMLTGPQMVWGEAPPALPMGAKIVVVSGDPGQAGLFTLRLKFPPGYKIAAHTHPTDEHVTVIAGVLSLGMGDAYDAKALHALPAGSYAIMPAQMRHFAYTKAGATVQLHGMGPFVLNYVNPADDPRNAK
jgi:quercetin dioxygenase-like cupin family protein